MKHRCDLCGKEMVFKIEKDGFRNVLVCPGTCGYMIWLRVSDAPHTEEKP